MVVHHGQVWGDRAESEHFWMNRTGLLADSPPVALKKATFLNSYGGSMAKSARSGVHSPRSFVKLPITPAALARVQRVVAKQNDGRAPKGSYVGRMQKAAAKIIQAKP